MTKIIYLYLLNNDLTSSFKKSTMKKIKLDSGFTIFILFFGIATLDAIKTQTWPRIIFWIAIGLIFLLEDNLKKA